ncbi:hypothetical protein ACFLU5_11830 [Bacteroidota bacterium]
MRRKTIILFGVVLIIGLGGILMTAARYEQIDDLLIFTQVSSEDGSILFDDPDVWRYSIKARIVAVDIDDPANEVDVLTSDFYSARSPEVSYDGNKLLFTACLIENDPWQIWEMDLYEKSYRSIISRNENCTDPVYLPDGRILYSVQEKDSIGNVINAIYAVNADGCCENRLTFHPHNDFAPSVHKDGRVLVVSQQNYPNKGDQIMLVMRPDGTKAEMYYKSEEKASFMSRGWETPAGRFVFIESTDINPGNGSLISISHNRPLHSRIEHSKGYKGNFHSVYPLQSGALMVSYQESAKDIFGLYEYDLTTNNLGEKLVSDAGFHCIEPVMAVERLLPRKLPTRVDKKIKRGYYVCLNTDFSQEPTNVRGSTDNKTRIVEVIGLGGKIVDIQVEEDGSFYLELPPDTPVRFQTLNENGELIRGPSAWTWVRPNERRGCVGCHEDREYAPENIVPLAIDKKPVSLLLEEQEVRYEFGH